MKIVVLAFAVLLSSALFGQEPMTTAGVLGASSTIRIVSSDHIEKAWRRDVVMVGSDGEIRGDGGTVESKVKTDSIDAAASNCVWISQRAQTSMNDSMQYLYSHTNDMAQYCVEIAMHIQPETVRSNITGYVVKTTTSGGYDYQDVWYDRVMVLKPIRYVEYSYYGGTESVKAEWQNWTTNGVDVTVDGKTWSGCHRCRVQRPSFAANEVCLDLPNELWGKNGMTWGDMALQMDGNDLYTGFVTNGVTGEVIYFDNGFYCNTPSGAAQ